MYSSRFSSLSILPDRYFCRPMNYLIVGTSRTLIINYHKIIQELHQAEDSYGRAKCKSSRRIRLNAEINQDNA